MLRIRSIAVSVILMGGAFVFAQPQNGGLPQRQSGPTTNQPPQGAPTSGQPTTTQPGQGNGSGMMKPDEGCRKERETACPDMHPGDGKWGPCMKEHMDSFSPRCKRRFHHMMRAHMMHNGQGGQGQGGHNQGNQAQGAPAQGGPAEGGQEQGAPQN